MSKKARAKKSSPKSTGKSARKTAPKATSRSSRKSAPKAAARPAKRASKKVARKAPARASARGSGRASSAAASRATVNQALEYLQFSAKMADSQIDNLPDEHALAQLAGANNHKAWTLGHQALSRAWFTSSITGTMPPVPESYHGLFGSSSKPSNDPSFYPPLEELRTNYRASLDALVSAVKSLTDADLDKPAHGDSGGFITTKLDAVLKAAWHEGWHGGQVATLRRGLGLPPLM